MSFTAVRLFELLPTIYRLRDGDGNVALLRAIDAAMEADHALSFDAASATVARAQPDLLRSATPGALRALVDVIAQVIAQIEDDVARLYDDQFIETCADALAPYIGDLVGYRTLGVYGATQRSGSPRAEVANTIAYRRRKGTASMLEQLARDVTGWDARVVEFFQLLATTQFVRHVRPDRFGITSVRDADALAQLGGPFDRTCRTLEVRRIASGRGRSNIPNVGIFLWRIRDFPLADVPATEVGPGRYTFSPLGGDAPLFSRPQPEPTITHIAERADVAAPITRRELWRDLASFYPRSISVAVSGVTVPAALVSASDLSDRGVAWAYRARDRVLIDPERGRLALPDELTIDGTTLKMDEAPVVSFAYGFSGELGGGPYERTASFTEPVVATVRTGDEIGPVVDANVGAGAVEVSSNARFDESLAITVPDGASFELRGATLTRPVLALDADLDITIGDDATLTLNGFVIAGYGLHVLATSGRGELRLVHCTLVPGLTLATAGAFAASLIVDSDEVTVTIKRSILGPLRVQHDATVTITDSIVDAGGDTEVAYAAGNGVDAGGALTVDATTLFGKVHARTLDASNAILAARALRGDGWPYPVRVERRQQGCARYSYVPLEAWTPRRYRCQPTSGADALRMRPQFTSRRYGDPAYGQLDARTAAEIRAGADDDGEMGAFHFLATGQRERNVAVRLDEYLRFALEAGIIRSS